MMFGIKNFEHVSCALLVGGTRTVDKKRCKVLAASLTPIRNDSSIDSERFASHVNWLLDSGCDAAVLFGTTGEGNSFSVGERKEAVDSLLEAGVAPTRLVVGTGCCALPDTLELTNHALARGINSVLVLPPFYYKTASDQGIFDTFAKLIADIDDSRLKIILYHFPKMAVVSFSPELIAKLVESFPEQIVGIKDSTGDQAHTQMLNERFPTLDVYAGSEMFLLDYLRSGGVGCISATANVTAELAAQVRDAIDSADADSLQMRLSAVRSAFEQFPLTGALKGYLALESLDDDWTNVREPLSCLDRSQVADLALALSDLEYRLNYAA